LTDSWQTDDPRAPRELTIQQLINRRPYLASSDKQGHSTALSAKVAKDFARYFSEVAFSRRTPYRNTSDAIRDALYLGMHIIRARYFGDENEAWEAEAEAIETMNRISENATIRERMESFARSIAKLRDEGDVDVALESLATMIRRISHFPDEWRRKKHFLSLKKCYNIQDLINQLDEETKSFVEGA